VTCCRPGAPQFCREPGGPETVPEPYLTHREHEVLVLVVKGYQNKEIAARLHIATSTVKFHIRALFHKYCVDNRTRLVYAAYEAQDQQPPTEIP